MDKKTNHHGEKKTQQYLLARRNLRKQSVKWGDTGRGDGLACSLCSCTISTIKGNPLLCIQPHVILTMSLCCMCVCVSPSSCLFYPSPHSLPRLLLTLVCPDEAFMLKQFRAVGKHLFCISLLMETSHRQRLLVIRSDQRYFMPAADGMFEKNKPWKFDPDWPITTTP